MIAIKINAITKTQLLKRGVSSHGAYAHDESNQGEGAYSPDSPLKTKSGPDEKLLDTSLQYQTNIGSVIIYFHNANKTGRLKRDKTGVVRLVGIGRKSK